MIMSLRAIIVLCEFFWHLCDNRRYRFMVCFSWCLAIKINFFHRAEGKKDFALKINRSVYRAVVNMRLMIGIKMNIKYGAFQVFIWQLVELFIPTKIGKGWMNIYWNKQTVSVHFKLICRISSSTIKSEHVAWFIMCFWGKTCTRKILFSYFLF